MRTQVPDWLLDKFTSSGKTPLDTVEFTSTGELDRQIFPGARGVELEVVLEPTGLMTVYFNTAEEERNHWMGVTPDTPWEEVETWAKAVAAMEGLL